MRGIAAVLDLSWVHAELAPYYPKIGRPSIDPVLMIRMLIIGYVFGIRSERLLCREVKVNMAYLSPRRRAAAIALLAVAHDVEKRNVGSRSQEMGGVGMHFCMTMVRITSMFVCPARWHHRGVKPRRYICPGAGAIS